MSLPLVWHPAFLYTLTMLLEQSFLFMHAFWLFIADTCPALHHVFFERMSCSIPNLAWQVFKPNSHRMALRAAFARLAVSPCLQVSQSVRTLRVVPIPRLKCRNCYLHHDNRNDRVYVLCKKHATHKQVNIWPGFTSFSLCNRWIYHKMLSIKLTNINCTF